MTGFIILILFAAVGAASLWFGFDFLPAKLLRETHSLGNPKIIFTAIGSFIGLTAGLLFQSLRRKATEQIRTTPTDLLISRSIGLILGLIIATLLLLPLLFIPIPKAVFFLKPVIAIISNIFFGVLGYNLGEIHGRTFLRLLSPNSTEAVLIGEGILTPASGKILDTSVIIDGRIKGLLKSGLIEGQVIVAETVIEELQKLADSSNSEKRSKGRRGLKLLNELREDYGRKLVVNSTRYDGTGTDEKLLQLTEYTNGTLITADFNLAQVAQVKELKVINLSDLVIALRPEIQPGEKLSLKIVREGKEETQGVGYLDDGTMVVIDGAKKFIGERLEVIITGALQTPSGRMIFGKLEKKDYPANKSDPKTNSSAQ